ncbi:MAG: transaldolase [Patescibacteria group bacterium]|nr:transaldolase [Patescibacteria group bacterium]
MQIFLDSANLEALKQYPFVAGMTTNPTIMFKAGVKDYEAFARSVLQVIGNMPISFEVFADEFQEMERQTKIIGSWGGNSYIKIPITNTTGDSSLPLVRRLLDNGLKVNVTAILTSGQVNDLHSMLKPNDDLIVSIFAGRIADTGVDPQLIMRSAVEQFRDLPLAKILWASCREVLNVYQAEACGCHIITVPDDILKKLNMKHKDLAELSLETVKMFYSDAQKAGFTL